MPKVVIPLRGYDVILHRTRKACGVMMALAAAIVLSAASAAAIVTHDGTAQAQEYYDTPQALAVMLVQDSRYLVQDEQGHAVLTGMVENRGTSYVSNVQIWAIFYDDAASAPVDVVAGYPAIEVIPPNSMVPFEIVSSEPNLGITDASARIGGFDSAPTKESLLSVEVESIKPYASGQDVRMAVRGTIYNGPAPSEHAVVHIAYHDAFDPPRTLGIDTITAGPMGDGEAVPFEADFAVPLGTERITIHAETDIYHLAGQQSPRYMAVDLPPPYPVLPPNIVTISGVSLRDGVGTVLSSAQTGQTVYVRADASVLPAAHEGEQGAEIPYTFYVQVREASPDAPVEFIGKSDGRFVVGQNVQVQSVDWIPENPGLYVAETFVWDRSDVPLAERGPYMLILVE